MSICWDGNKNCVWQADAASHWECDTQYFSQYEARTVNALMHAYTMDRFNWSMHYTAELQILNRLTGGGLVRQMEHRLPSVLIACLFFVKFFIRFIQWLLVLFSSLISWEQGGHFGLMLGELTKYLKWKWLLFWWPWMCSVNFLTICPLFLHSSGHFGSSLSPEKNIKY